MWLPASVEDRKLEINEDQNDSTGQAKRWYLICVVKRTVSFKDDISNAPFWKNTEFQ